MNFTALFFIVQDLSILNMGFFIYVLGIKPTEVLMFKDKEILEELKGIRNKLDVLVAMLKAEKIKKANKSAREGK